MRTPKVLAMYLPQFHRVKENDEWWGEGFTEWSTVRAAKPLYPGHEQPKKPMEYYDLMDKETMYKQAEYMHQYGIDGMCFYHYYFENGKKILEKPAENLLKWTDINMPFCFCWANQPWARSWSNIAGNSWSEIFEPEKDKDMSGVLLAQNYGGQKDWEKHFNYLLPFFKDERYVTKDGHPIFVFYTPSDIEQLKEMKEYWNELMERENMPSIYFIGRGDVQEALDGALIHEPVDAWEAFREHIYQNTYGLYYYLDYDEVWEKILKKRYIQKDTYLGGFVNFDSTPRRGKNGKVIYGGHPEKFKKYMTRLFLKAGLMESDFVFVNAWNEWGEGMYLEPDEKWGFQYLEALKSAKGFVEKHGDMVEASWLDNASIQDVNNEISSVETKKAQRYKGYWETLSRWMELYLQGKSVCTYLEQGKFSNIAIYGLGILGKPLVHEMYNHDMRVAYGIDQDEYKGKGFEFPVYQLQDELPETDIIIVTVGYAFEHIKKQLMEKSECRIISLSELLDFAERGNAE